MYNNEICLVWFGVSEGSNKREETKDGDEEELEAICGKAKKKIFSSDIITEVVLGICPFLGLSSEEGGDAFALGALNDSETVVKDEFGPGNLGSTCQGSRGVECRVTGNLKFGVGEIRGCKIVDGTLVSSSRDFSSE